MLRCIGYPGYCIASDFVLGMAALAWFIIVSILILVRLDKIIKALEKK